MAASKTQAAAAKPWRPLTVETDEKLEELLAQPGIKGERTSTHIAPRCLFVDLQEHSRPVCANSD